MSQVVVTGSSVTCTCGTAPGTINVSSQATVMPEGKPMGTIQDIGASAITPFGMCTSMANPAVASATAVAMGVLTPQPCTMVPNGPWIPSNTTVIIGGQPCLTNDCKLTCAYGGSINIVDPGQKTVSV